MPSFVRTMLTVADWCLGLLAFLILVRVVWLALRIHRRRKQR